MKVIDDAHGDDIRSLSVSTDGTAFLTTSFDGTAKVYSYSSFLLLHFYYRSIPVFFFLLIIMIIPAAVGFSHIPTTQNLRHKSSTRSR